MVEQKVKIGCISHSFDVTDGPGGSEAGSDRADQIERVLGADQSKLLD